MASSYYSFSQYELKEQQKQQAASAFGLRAYAISVVHYYIPKNYGSKSYGWDEKECISAAGMGLEKGFYKMTAVINSRLFLGYI